MKIAAGIAGRQERTPVREREKGQRARWLGAVVATGGLAGMLGCALAASPQPPTLWLPEPVHDLTAQRVEGAAVLHWTMPKRTTDKVTLRGDQQAQVCWMEGTAPRFEAQACHEGGRRGFAPGKPAKMTVQLPAELLRGKPGAVRFFVELKNHEGKTAGPSNAAWIASGTAPAAVTGLRGEARAAGVVLHWTPGAATAGLTMRLHRTLVAQPGAPKPNEAAGVAPAEQQTLEVDLSEADRGEALDRDAALDHIWQYTAERVQRVTLRGQKLEIAGPASAAMTVNAKDVFPPAAPEGLAAVADAQAKTIDLSWTPDAEADVAGYVVYRRDVTGGTALERISGKALVVAPAFEDRAVVAGHRYAYAVSAVDGDGNESARSREVTEELPE